MPEKLRDLLPPLLILLLAPLLFATNYIPDTWLSGWDNLHPEFNFPLNIKRSLFAAWQEYQGLGLVGGMGHAADLIRQISLWPISFILPSNSIRYSYHFIMLLAGSMGMYFLLKQIIFKSLPHKRIGAFIAAICYLFNLATLQIFRVPFEPFSTHFAFLPWLFLVNLKFLGKSNKKNLIFLILINILATPQGYVGTCFLIYIIALTITFFIILIKKKKLFKKILIAYFIVFALNAFWLLPNLYFIINHTKVNTLAKINQMATKTNLLKNQEYGDIANTTLLKGFLFDTFEINNKTKETNCIMKDWPSYLNKPPIATIGYFIFATSLVGIFIAAKKKHQVTIIFLPIFLLGFTFLSNRTPPFSFINNITYRLPLIPQIFRFPFTKFATITSFGMAIFYSFAVLSCLSLVKQKSLKTIAVIMFSLLPIIFLFPAFQGKLFYSKNKAQIPEEYFQTFQFFNSRKSEERIANFPQSTFWGWIFSQWNYSGSGFIWYGIKQPILDRAFDVWNSQNENYYWEISYALYSQNQNLFESILEKYQIRWLLIDKNIVNHSSPKSLYFSELEQMLSSSKKISLKKEFGKIKIYQVNLKKSYQNFISLSGIPANIGPKYNWNNYDLAYLENGDYLTDPQSQPQIYYPFRSLFTSRSQKDLEFNIENKENYFLFKAPMDQKLLNYYLDVPPFYQKALLSIAPNNLANIHYQSPEIYYNGNILEAIIPKIKGYFSANIEAAGEYSDLKLKNCDQFNQEGVVKNEVIQKEGKKFLRLSATNACNCSTSFWLPNLPHQYAYLITIESRNLEGQSLLFWLENLNIRKADIESYLPQNERTNISYFIQPPMEKDGLGYTLHFDNISIGKTKTINDLGKITINLIPFDFLASLKLVPPKQENNNHSKKAFDITNFEVYHPNPSFYKVKIKNLNNTEPFLLTLSQSFEKGWIASQGKHVLVNNWANGWLIDSPSEEKSQEIIIFFWPQLLEYLGFLLIPVSFILVKKLKC